MAPHNISASSAAALPAHVKRLTAQVLRLADTLAACRPDDDERPYDADGCCLSAQLAKLRRFSRTRPQLVRKLRHLARAVRTLNGRMERWLRHVSILLTFVWLVHVEGGMYVFVCAFGGHNKYLADSIQELYVIEAANVQRLKKPQL